MWSPRFKDSWVPVKTRRSQLPAFEKNVRPCVNLIGSRMKMPW
ncbi:hypothetical protein [Mobilicoccus sp.]|nr:hypothetical protein [Mobilicoccus sp.]